MDWKMFVLYNEVHYKEATAVEVVDMKTLDAVVKYKEGKTCVLNFASFKNPGGVFGNEPKLSKDREFYSAGSVK